MKTSLLAPVFATVLLAAACGGDDAGTTTSIPDDPRAQELVELLQADEEFPISDAEANCTANNMFENLDDETIDLLLETTELDLDQAPNPEDAITAFDALLDCVDLEQMMVDSMLDDGTPEATARCIAEGFGEDELRGILSASALPGDAVDEAAAFALLGQIFELAQECGLES